MNPAPAGHTPRMDEIDGVQRFEDDDEANVGDPVQGLWRLQNEARRQADGLPSPAWSIDPAESEPSSNVHPLHRG